MRVVSRLFILLVIFGSSISHGATTGISGISTTQLYCGFIDGTYVETYLEDGMLIHYSSSGPWTSAEVNLDPSSGILFSDSGEIGEALIGLLGFEECGMLPSVDSWGVVVPQHCPPFGVDPCCACTRPCSAQFRFCVFVGPQYVGVCTQIFVGCATPCLEVCRYLIP